MPAATKPKPVIRIEDITPSKAEKYLDRNTHNRTLRMPKAEALAEAIKRGEWEFNGDAIRFDVNGTLLDGQHRLWAIVLSEKTCRSVVVENLDPDSQMTMDRPTAVRNLSDTLQLMGYKAHGRLAPALNYLWKMENGKVRERAVTPTIAQALALLAENPSLVDSLQTATNFRKRFRGSEAAIAAIHYTLASIDSEDADEFFTKLIGGVALEEKDPVYVLRAWLERHQSGKLGQRASNVVMHAMIVKAWNFWRDGELVDRISWKATGIKAEALPEPR